MGHHTTQLCNFYIGPDDQPKKIKKKKKKKIKKKSPLSMHHTTQLCNFYIGPDDQPKKINEKKKKKKNHLYLCTILHNYATSTLDLTINPKKSTKKKKKKKITFIYAPYYTIMQLL